MRPSVSTYSLSRWRREEGKTYEDCLEWFSKNGIGAVDFSNLDDKPVEDLAGRAKYLKKKCDDLGLAIGSYCTGAELLVEPAKQKTVVDGLKKHIEAAAILGVKSMRHDVTRGWGEHSAGVEGDQNFRRAVEVVVPALRETAEFGKGVGVIITLENHGYYMQESKRVERLIQSVDHPNYRLTLDVGNFLCVEENPTNAVKRVLKYAVMVHVKDFHVRPKSHLPLEGWFPSSKKIALRGAVLGHGVVDVPLILKMIHKSGYKGFVSLEFEGIEEPTKAVKMGVAFLKAQLTALNALD